MAQQQQDPEQFTDMSVRNTAALLSMLAMMRQNEAPRPAFAWKTTALVSATCTLEASRQTAAWATPVVKRTASTSWSATKSAVRWLRAHRPSITFVAHEA